ncbi:MAG: hypothetical protein ACYDC6_09390 [Acidobacteriaceae bacterium]
MRKILFSTILLGCFACMGLPSAVAQGSSQAANPGFKQDMKNTGSDTNNAAKSAGRDMKKNADKTGHAVKRDTKRATHATARKTDQGARKVERKTQPNPQR